VRHAPGPQEPLGTGADGGPIDFDNNVVIAEVCKIQCPQSKVFGSFDDYRDRFHGRPLFASLNRDGGKETPW
jgi:hypothetical protein